MQAPSRALQGSCVRPHLQGSQGVHSFVHLPSAWGQVWTENGARERSEDAPLMVLPSTPSSIRMARLDQGKRNRYRRSESCLLPSFAPRDLSPILTLQPSPLPLGFSLRKTECCPFNLTGFWKRAARS